MYDIQSLINAINQGKKFEYLFFYKKSKPFGIFSQWWDKHPFVIDNITYQTAEHWMMAEKARVFGDDLIEAKILATSDPDIVKKLGRKVYNFRKSVWKVHAFDIVYKGNIQKFTQHTYLKNLLLSTDNKVLVEASPYDDVWGIKMNEYHPDAENPLKWKGASLLGFVLMKVRDDLRKIDNENKRLY